MSDAVRLRENADKEISAILERLERDTGLEVSNVSISRVTNGRFATIGNTTAMADAEGYTYNVSVRIFV